MEKKWIQEDFEYNESTAGWRMKDKWELADMSIKLNLGSAVFNQETIDWAIVNEFMTYLQKRHEQVKDDLRRIGAIINALAAANSDPVLHGKLRLEEIVLKRYAESGYRFTYDYLFTAGIPDKIFRWTASLKDSSITGVSKS